MFLAYSHLRAGRLADALGALDRAPAPSSQLSVVRAHLLAASGATTDASRMLTEVEAHFDANPVPRGSLALAHLALGEEDAAFVWLEKGFVARDQSVRTIKLNPMWEPIRFDPRYRALLKRMNLKP